MNQHALLEKKTGNLFEKLWPQYDDKLFEDSLQLFYKRLDAWGIPREFFKGKKCLDAGCGGGRYAIAMARLGAIVEGIDLGKDGIRDARKRAKGAENVMFRTGSIENLPFGNSTFDIVVNAGVLQHTASPGRVVSELARVLKPGGSLYMLVYATGGLRWPLISQLRCFASEIGIDAMEQAVESACLPPNKRRVYLDDLYCPLIDFYSWDRLTDLLRLNGLSEIRRMPRDLFDHEASLSAYREDIQKLSEIFESGVKLDIAGKGKLFRMAFRLCGVVLENLGELMAEIDQKRMAELAAMEMAVGQGHHRVWAIKQKK